MYGKTEKSSFLIIILRGTGKVKLIWLLSLSPLTIIMSRPCLNIRKQFKNAVDSLKLMCWVLPLNTFIFPILFFTYLGGKGCRFSNKPFQELSREAIDAGEDFHRTTHPYFYFNVKSSLSPRESQPQTIQPWNLNQVSGKEPSLWLPCSVLGSCLFPFLFPLLKNSDTFCLWVFSLKIAHKTFRKEWLRLNCLEKIY